MDQRLRNVTIAAALVGAVVLLIGLLQGGLAPETTHDETCPGTDPLCGSSFDLTPILLTIAGTVLLVGTLVVAAVDRWRASR